MVTSVGALAGNWRLSFLTWLPGYVFVYWSFARALGGYGASRRGVWGCVPINEMCLSSLCFRLSAELVALDVDHKFRFCVVVFVMFCCLLMSLRVRLVSR